MPLDPRFNQASQEQAQMQFNPGTYEECAHAFYSEQPAPFLVDFDVNA